MIAHWYTKGQPLSRHRWTPASCTNNVIETINIKLADGVEAISYTSVTSEPTLRRNTSGAPGLDCVMVRFEKACFLTKKVLKFGQKLHENTSKYHESNMFLSILQWGYEGNVFAIIAENVPLRLWRRMTIFWGYFSYIFIKKRLKSY